MATPTDASAEDGDATSLRETGTADAGETSPVDSPIEDSDFTDVRTGSLYAFNANVLQLYVSATF